MGLEESGFYPIMQELSDELRVVSIRSVRVIRLVVSDFYSLVRELSDEMIGKVCRELVRWAGVPFGMRVEMLSFYTEVW